MAPPFVVQCSISEIIQPVDGQSKLVCRQRGGHGTKTTKPLCQGLEMKSCIFCVSRVFFWPSTAFSQPSFTLAASAEFSRRIALQSSRILSRLVTVLLQFSVSIFRNTKTKRNLNGLFKYLDMKFCETSAEIQQCRFCHRASCQEKLPVMYQMKSLPVLYGGANN